MERAGTWTLLGGFAVYYVLSVGMAFVLRDQRGFCKYLCPNGAILRITSRAALMKVASDPAKCSGCGACSRVCPMDIDVAPLAGAGLRVASGECILCQNCAHACPTGALSLKAGRMWPV